MGAGGFKVKQNDDLNSTFRPPMAPAGPRAAHPRDRPHHQGQGGQEALGDLLQRVLLQRQQRLVLLQGRQPSGAQGIPRRAREAPPRKLWSILLGTLDLYPPPPRLPPFPSLTYTTPAQQQRPVLKTF